MREDALDLTFEEWDATDSENVNSSQMPLAMIINSSELRAAGFTLQKVLPPKLEAATCRRCTRGVGIRQREGMGPTRFMSSVDADIESARPRGWKQKKAERPKKDVCISW